MTGSLDSAKKEAAILGLLRAGLRPIPNHGILADGKCACGNRECGSPGKHPCIPWGEYQKRAPTEFEVQTWIRTYRGANWGIVLGESAGLVAVDCDGPKAEELLLEHGIELPESATVLSHRGAKVLLRHPGGVFPKKIAFLRNDSSAIDLLGDGCQLCAPPSNHYLGGNYTWIIPPSEGIADPPPALLELVRAAARDNGANPIHNEKAPEDRIPHGERNIRLTSLAGGMRRHGMSQAAIGAALLEENIQRCDPPLAKPEVRKIAASVGRYEPAPKPAGDHHPLTDQGATGKDLGDLPRIEYSSPLGISGGAFLRQSFPSPSPIIEDLLSDEGGGWRGGEEKLGKSIEILDETICLTFALPVLGRFPVPTPRRVLLISEEDSPRRTWRRLRALLRGHNLDPDDPAVQVTLDDRLRVSAWEGFRFDDAAMVTRLEATIAEHKSEVVYLDVLRKLTMKDLNKADQASVILDLLDGMRRRNGCVFILVHHYRKAQGFRTGRGSQEIGGSYVLGAWGENSLFFEPIGRKQGPVRVEVQTKDGPPVPAFRLIVESDGPKHDPVWIRLRAEEDRSGEDADDLIYQAVATLPKVEALAGKPGVSVAAIAGAVKRSDKTVRRALKRLLNAGRVLVIGQASKQKDLYGVNDE